jgi:YidC/Oxa1 family membrane protein insertase
MFAGFAPLLLQWPFLSVMYLLFRSPTVGGTANTLLTHDVFGVPLGAHWLSGVGLASAQGVVFVGLFALLAALCWLSARLGSLMTAQATGAKPAGSPGLLVRALPYLIVVIAAFAPLAAGIYLLTTLAWSLAERMLYARSAAGPEGLARPEKLAGKAGPLSAPTTDPAAGGSLRSGPA